MDNYFDINDVKILQLITKVFDWQNLKHLNQGDVNDEIIHTKKNNQNI